MVGWDVIAILTAMAMAAHGLFSAGIEPLRSAPIPTIAGYPCPLSETSVAVDM